jgi:hypothetical protein
MREAARWAASFCVRHTAAICAFILTYFLNWAGFGSSLKMPHEKCRKGLEFAVGNNDPS